tara:strand:+ start:5397 stop:6002 length:606 start_codon:yes stop_codon:yes gene_type:complete
MACDIYYNAFDLEKVEDQTKPRRGGILFNDKEIDIINNTLKELPWKKAQLNNPGGSEKIDEKIRISDIKFIPFDNKTEWFYKKIFGKTKEMNEKYYNFKLHGLVDNLQYGRYLEDGKYEFHIDNGSGKAKYRKLSCSILLSDPSDFEGGNFQIYNSCKISNYNLKKGEIIFFPSWTLHRVKPVTDGERMSLVGWFGGTPYQ